MAFVAQPLQYILVCDSCGEVFCDMAGTGPAFDDDPGRMEREAAKRGWTSLKGRMFCPGCSRPRPDVPAREKIRFLD